MHLVRCRVQGHRDGYGFAQPAEGGDDFYLSARQMRSLFDGDTVLVAQSRVDSRGRPEGKVVEILERGVSRVVGRYQEESGIGVVLPDNARINQDILIPPKQKGGAQHGQIVTAEITQYPEGGWGPRGASSRCSVSTWTRGWRSTSPSAPTRSPTSGPRQRSRGRKAAR
jgi:ribonuclease R